MRFPQTVRGGFARAVAATVVLLLLATPAKASIMRFLSIEELAGESALVVRARITGQSVHWTANQEGIYTEIQAVVLGDVASGSLQGPVVRGRRLTIIQAGGEIDGVSLDWTGRPTFRDGEDLILFLQSYDSAAPSDPRYLVVGGKQGRMRVLEDPSGRTAPMVERDLVGVLDAPFIEGDEPKGPAHRRDLMSLDELRGRARAARGGRP